MTIEKTFPNKPIDILLKDLSCLQSWNILLKEGDKELILPALDQLVAWCYDFQPNVIIRPDVVEL